MRDIDTPYRDSAWFVDELGSVARGKADRNRQRAIAGNEDHRLNYFNGCPHIGHDDMFSHVEGFRAGVQVFQCLKCGLYAVYDHADGDTHFTWNVEELRDGE